jgi:hypothetical protein
MTLVTLRRRLGGPVLAAGLALATLVGTPGAMAAGPASEPGADLLGPSPTAGSEPPQRRSYGYTSAEDGTLRAGCHDYHYRYVLRTPTDDWTLETFLRDPTGDTIASGVYSSDSEPRRGRGVFRFCRYSTRPGRFTIRAKVHWYDGSEDHLVWLDPSHFRLRRAR